MNEDEIQEAVWAALMADSSFNDWPPLVGTPKDGPNPFWDALYGSLAVPAHLYKGCPAYDPTAANLRLFEARLCSYREGLAASLSRCVAYRTPTPQKALPAPPMRLALPSPREA